MRKYKHSAREMFDWHCVTAAVNFVVAGVLIIVNFLIGKYQPFFLILLTL